MRVVSCRSDGQVARAAVDGCVLKLVDQGDVEGERIEPHAADAGQVLGLLRVVLLMRVQVNASELLAPSPAAILLLAGSLVVSLVRPVGA